MHKIKKMDKYYKYSPDLHILQQWTLTKPTTKLTSKLDYGIITYEIHCSSKIIEQWFEANTPIREWRNYIAQGGSRSKKVLCTKEWFYKQ